MTRELLSEGCGCWPRDNTGGVEDLEGLDGLNTLSGLGYDSRLEKSKRESDAVEMISRALSALTEFNPNELMESIVNLDSTHGATFSGRL